MAPEKKKRIANPRAKGKPIQSDILFPSRTSYENKMWYSKNTHIFGINPTGLPRPRSTYRYSDGFSISHGSRSARPFFFFCSIRLLVCILSCEDYRVHILIPTERASFAHLRASPLARKRVRRLPSYWCVCGGTARGRTVDTQSVTVGEHNKPGLRPCRLIASLRCSPFIRLCGWWGWWPLVLHPSLSFLVLQIIMRRTTTTHDRLRSSRKTEPHFPRPA